MKSKDLACRAGSADSRASTPNEKYSNSLISNKIFTTFAYVNGPKRCQKIDFLRRFCDFCKVPIEDFPKNHDSEHDFDDQHEVNSRKSCSVFMILSDLDNFREEDPHESTISRYLSIVLGSLCRPRRHEKEGPIIDDLSRFGYRVLVPQPA